MHSPRPLQFILVSLMLMIGVTWTAGAQGLRFAYEPPTRFGPNESARVLVLRGEVAAGDLVRLENFISAAPENFVAHGARVVFVIDGGDVEEAKLIGVLLRDALLHVWLPDAGSTRCLSACFFMFAAAVSRDAAAATVGVHRPYIEPDALADAEAEAVRARYLTLMRDVRAHLEELLVPRELIEKMLATPWNESYRLSAHDLERLGTTQSWYEDYIAAKCHFEPALQRRLREARESGLEAQAQQLQVEWQRATHCVDALLRNHRAAFARSLRQRSHTR